MKAELMLLPFRMVFSLEIWETRPTEKQGLDRAYDRQSSEVSRALYSRPTMLPLVPIGLVWKLEILTCGKFDPVPSA